MSHPSPRGIQRTPAYGREYTTAMPEEARQASSQILSHEQFPFEKYPGNGLAVFPLQ